jgi:hypothetical protein
MEVFKMRRLAVVFFVLMMLPGVATAQYRPEYMLNRLDTLIARGASQITAMDSTVTILSAVTDSYGMMNSTGRVTVTINAAADSVTYGTPKYYAINMTGYSRCTLKMVHGGGPTKAVPQVNCLLSESSDITLATGNPVWFDTTPADSALTGWVNTAAPTSNLGWAIPITDVYGNWATADYLIIKVTAATAGKIRGLKLIAIKEQ